MSTDENALPHLPPTHLSPPDEPKDDAASTHTSPSPSALDDLPKGQGNIDAFAATFDRGWRFYLAFSSLLVITLMAALDATSLSVAIPKITTVLKGTAIEGFWSGTSFLLTSTVFQPVLGSFSSIFGRKPLVLISLALFLVGAILAAVAHSMTLLLVGRSVQGVGGGGVLVLTEIIVTDLVPLRFRGNYFSLIASMWAIGSVSGPLIGGAFSQELHFQVTTQGQQLRRVDWVGMVLFIGSTTGILIPITWGGVNYAWDSWRTLVPLLVSAVGFMAFIIWGDRYAPDPLIRTRVVKSRSAAISYFGDFIHGLVLWCSLYYMPLYYQAVRNESAIMSGVDLFPATFTVAPAAIVVGAVIGKIGKYRWAVWLGWTLATLGYGLSYLLDVGTSTVAWVFITFVAGLGTGVLYPSLTFAIQASTPNADQAYAVSLFTFFRAAGQCVGVAVGGTIFQNRIKSEILSHPVIAAHADAWSADATVLVQVIKRMPEGVARSALVQSFADALEVVWIVVCALSAVALVVSLGMKEFGLDRELVTDQGFMYEGKNGDVESDGKN